MSTYKLTGSVSSSPCRDVGRPHDVYAAPASSGDGSAEDAWDQGRRPTCAAVRAEGADLRGMGEEHGASKK